MSNEAIKKLLAKAGVTINGDQPWDIHVANPQFYERVLADGSLGPGESYVDGWWECPRLDELFHKIIRANVDKEFRSWRLLMNTVKAKVLNQQKKSKAFEVGEKHYDLGNDLYENMLDRRMVYSCGYWKNASTLDEAQEHKLELVCKKLGLKPGMRLLDIGCGWGSFVKYAAEKYQVESVGITVSQEQKVLAEESCKNLPIEIRLMDYRDLNETFDRVASIGMFEHVGYKNYRRYMDVASRCLKKSGLFLLHTIGTNTTGVCTDPWLDKYIFPNSMIPSIQQIGKAIEGLFVMEHWENFGPDYDKTLMAWFSNFHKHWEKIKSKYDDRFYRMWKYYLHSCAGAFRARYNQVWQVLLSRTA
jgi:cyclopropane-fatty-acyl-phospholipid synthase